MSQTINGGHMENQFDYGKIIENLSSQIAAQAQQIAFLQALIQQIAESNTEETPTEEQGTEPADATS